MTDAIRLYFRYISLSIRSQAQYRASVLLVGLGNFLFTTVDFLGIWVLLSRFGNIRGWQLHEVALFYGMVNIAFSAGEMAARGFDFFPALVRSGGFDRILLRPRSTALQVAAQDWRLDRLGRMLQGIFVLAWAAAGNSIQWTLPKALLMAGSIAGGALLFLGLFILQATLAIWTVETLEIANTVTNGGVETAQYPLSIYKGWFRHFFTFVVPLACVNYLPLHAILGKTDELGYPVWVEWAAPLLGPLFFLVSLRVWRFGVSKYCSTGS